MNNKLFMTDKHDPEILERYSFTLPPRLINAVDTTRERMKISRSMSVRKALKHWLDHAVEEVNLEGNGIAVINYTFDHHEVRVVEDLSKAQHHLPIEILSINHMHIAHQACVEVITAKGRLQDLKMLVDAIKKIKGVRSVKSSYTHILKLDE